MICVSIEANDFDDSLKIINKYSFVELRLDRTNMNLKEIMQIFSMTNKLIAKCETGQFNLKHRLEILKSAIFGGAAYTDIEYDADEGYLKEIKSEAKKNSSKIILSFHDYVSVPEIDKLAEIIDNCFIRGADIVKIACQPNSEEDTVRLISLYNLFERGKVIIIGMGGYGKITRIAAPYLGSPFTYASLRRGLETASGQIDIESMKKIELLMQ